MAEPVIAARRPVPVDVEAGRTYYWCACGRSARQPFCDGSHRNSEFTPTVYVATKSARLWFCACKHAKSAPLCDGTHKTLPGSDPAHGHAS